MDKITLCDNCKDMMFMMSIGSCQTCGGTTSSMAYQYCESCAQQKQACMACGNNIK